MDKPEKKNKPVTLTDLLCYEISGRGRNFYARILAALEVKEMRDPRRCPMMAVRVVDRRITLFYNPVWFAKASYAEKMCVIKHEVYHLIFEHPARHLELHAMATSMDQSRLIERVSPIAMDCAVNSLLEENDTYLAEYKAEILQKFEKMKEIEKKRAEDPNFKDTFEDFVYSPFPELYGLVPKRSYEEYVLELMRRAKRDPMVSAKCEGALIVAGCFGDDHEGENGMSSMVGNGNGNGNGNEESKEKGQGTGGGFSDGDAEEKKSSDGGGDDQDEQDGQNGQGDSDEETDIVIALLSNHRSWLDPKNEVSPEDKLSLADDLHNKIKHIVRRAVEDHQKSRETIPAELAEVLNELLKDPVIPWTQILRDWVINTQRYRLRRSVTRPRRRHVGIPEFFPYPGYAKDRAFTIAWLIDTSASMGSGELELGLSELHGLQRADKDIDITVIEADAAVEHEYQLGSNDKINYEVHGRGGTSFDPALKRAKELRPDIVFYFTDGYAPAPQMENRPACPFAWVLTPNGKNPDPDWGHVIQTFPLDD